MITKKQLSDNQWRKFSWNGGAIIEYWKPLNNDDNFDYRIGVRFGEYKNTPPIVYLFIANAYISLVHIQSYEWLQVLYSALYCPGNPSLKDFVIGHA